MADTDSWYLRLVVDFLGLLGLVTLGLDAEASAALGCSRWQSGAPVAVDGHADVLRDVSGLEQIGTAGPQGSVWM